MNTDSTKKDLTRQLEQHLELLCREIIKDLSEIDELTQVTQDNFEYMTYVGESLETLQNGCEYIKKYLLTIKTAEKLLDRALPVFLKEE